MQSNTFKRMNKFVKDRREEGRGEEGLKLLFLFKIVKNRAIKYFKDKGIKWTEFEGEINEECKNLSKEIINKNRETPTEDEIKEVVENIKSELCKKLSIEISRKEFDDPKRKMLESTKSELEKFKI